METLIILGLHARSCTDEGKSNSGRGVDSQEQKRVLLVVDTAPVPTGSTAGIEPASEAEKAMAAKSDALVPPAQGETGRGRKMASLRHRKRINSLKCRATSLPPS